MSKKNEVSQKRSMVTKTDDTEYGLITKKLGNCRFSVRLNMQNKEVIGRVRGKFRRGSEKKTNWVDVDSVVLVGIRDFQDGIVDIIHVYDQAEVRQLKKSGEFVEESSRPDGDAVVEDDMPFDFEEI